MSYYESDKNDEYAPIAVGKYTAKIHQISCDLTSAIPKLNVQLRLENNRRLFLNFSFQDSSKKWISWQLGSVLGLSSKAKELVKNPESATPVDVVKSYVDASGFLIDKLVECEVTHREYNGKIYENVKLLGMSDSPQTTMAGVEQGPGKFDASETLPF